ncbi:MAG TPA: hypothetical protein VGN13_06385 [Solirubrobacteraceae bacterium]|jgi:hypothetical protein
MARPRGYGRSGSLTLAAILVTLFAWTQAARNAHAATFRRIAANTVAFAGDGTRYVAWEIPAPGATGRVLIVVLDTRTGRRFQTDTSCGLQSNEPAAAGRFLLECGNEGQALLDVRTGTVTDLPKPPPHEIGEYGPIWEGVGTHDVIGRAGLHARCHRSKRHESCTALYAIATGSVSLIPESRVPDPNRRGAPPLCPALRRKLFRRSEFETLEGLGSLAPLGSGFSYGEGVLAEVEPEPAVGASFGGNVLIYRCHGSKLVLRNPREGRLRHPFAGNLELDAGLLTWDTGHLASDFEEEEEDGGAEEELRQGTLSAYRLKMHQRRSWRLPVLPLKIIEAPENGTPSRVVRGVFGYSAHTAHDIFWIRAQSLSRYCDKVCAVTAEASAIYEARL